MDTFDNLTDADAKSYKMLLGGWEVLIDWGEDWAPTWESVKDIPQTAHVRHQVDMAKRHKRQATSWFEVLAGQEGVARAGARTKDETDRNRVTWQWQSVACNGRRVSAGEVGQAIRGDAEMSEEANRLDPLMRMVVRSDHRRRMRC